MKRIAPLILSQKYYKDIESEIRRILDQVIYLPLVDALAEFGISKRELLNARDALADSIRQGKIYYVDGKFTGEFNSAISKQLRDMGAKYNVRMGGWVFDGVLPAAISMAVAAAQVRNAELISAVFRTLDFIAPSTVDAISSLSSKYAKSIRMMDDQFESAVKSLVIPPKMTAEQVDFIATSWAKNLELYIKDWVAEDVLKLRADIQTKILSGIRAESIEKIIQQNYGVSTRKARFLARQETSLLMSKFRETRYAEIGITQYSWEGVMDQRERPDHKALEGKVFRWDDPPIVDTKNGRRGNPGEDFGCRCIAVPLLPEQIND